MVSSGIDLRPGDEVVVFHDNHPSNLTAWHEKAKRFGFYVIEIPQVNPHPGMQYYIDAYRKSITPKTKIITFTHLTSTVGDLFPAKELCARSEELAGALPAAIGEPPQVGRVLREVGESFLNFQVVAKREAEIRAELSAAPEVVAAVPYFDHDITGRTP